MLFLFRCLAPAFVFFLSMIAPAITSAEEATRYPVVIKHAFGTTTIARKPQRVATVAWANHEVPLALGIVPVGFAAANFGDDDGDGLLPWVAKQLSEMGAAKPVLFDEGDGIDFEAVAAMQPDVILAAYSGLSQSDYDTLSQIAPVVAYPVSPWATDWREMIRLNSAGLGMAPEGEALIKRIEGEIAQVVAGHPQLKGKSAMFVTHLDATNLSVVNFYTANDSRVKFFTDLGLTSPKSVAEATKPGQFAAGVSAERVDAFDDVDIVVTYGSQPLLKAMRADPLLARMPAVAHDAIVMLGRDPLGTASNPTPLSISWVLKDYADLLAKAADKSSGKAK
ncbi:iron-siderophore ABC transporter substrate-binding protein [Agrobacterium tumefaciens]|uniref:iron-siderophore ABC transporter substrate-binding protein n=1 Tax=Agrobacterium tumefaciens TaxID=358 RepID=UPI000DD02074|nr:iron-siderophore ABC transporter substrate-binding protein [Agrobacterium tumefaciens]NSZ65850.1 iron-siderophore ABC transporter substrate-binding protein [Agrobacterium tumefaciens]NTA72221.1 iron-siderophore ABC transporter substrate-binding protein [Agrobacterium tumefaciens]WIE39581.1 iron-siderophore ABC transporter substrate-binding protein [Agrobacterium tumefaciens]